MERAQPAIASATSRSRASPVAWPAQSLISGLLRKSRQVPRMLRFVLKPGWVSVRQTAHPAQRPRRPLPSCPGALARPVGPAAGGSNRRDQPRYAFMENRRRHLHGLGRRRRRGSSIPHSTNSPEWLTTNAPPRREKAKLQKISDGTHTFACDICLPLITGSRWRGSRGASARDA